MTKASLIFKVDTTDPVAFITVDDGYATDDQATAYVQANQVKVTQFLTFYAATSGAFPPPTSGPGLAHIEELRKYQSGVPEEKRVGCHGKEHVDYRTMSLADQQAQISAAADWLGGNDMFYWRPRLFRPPNGEWNADMLTASYNAGMQKMVLWTHWVNPATGLLTNEYGTPVLQPGSIIVVHHPTDPGMDGFLLDQLQTVLAAISDANLVPAYLHDYV
jgi:peptidoglycan/xylan/chitin deacetylase (PgdA/CDA1 family)